MSDRIMTLHPAGKEGVNIERSKYDAIRTAILDVLREQPGIQFKDLPTEIGRKLPDFDGSIGWYTTTVKLDLEARGEIERIPKSSPQQLRLRDTPT